jgi:hypothetical protein
MVREEYRLRVLENRVLRRTFGPKNVEVTLGWKKKKFNVDLHNLYSSPNIVRMLKSRRMRWGRLVAHVMEMKIVYKILVGKSEEKRPLGRIDIGEGIL